MKMRHELLRARHKLNDLIRQQVRLYRRYAEPLDTVSFIKRLHQLVEALFALLAAVGALAKVAEVDTCKHDLFGAGGNQLFDIRKHTLYAIAAAVAAGKGY